MKIIKNDLKGKTYQSDNFKIIYRNKGVILGNNSENKKELIYLINGSIKLTINDKTEVVKAPAKINIPANTYHKIEALNKISLILF